MKSWWWVLGVNLLLISACQGEVKPPTGSVVGQDSVLAPVDTSVAAPVAPVGDSVLPSTPAKVLPSLSEAATQDTVKRYPIIHIGDKDFDPNRYLGPYATEAQRKYARKMIAEDSLRRPELYHL